MALTTISAVAQKPITKKIHNQNTNIISKDLRTVKFNGSEVLSETYAPTVNRANTGAVIGNTTYDLQTNASNQRRIVNHGDGTLSASFIFGNNTGTGFSDRGTGYNYFDGSSWGANPTTRIETTRNGWPSLITSGDDEIIISHSGNGGLTMNRRSTKGTGSWVETTIPTSLGTDILWPRTALGGPNDSTIHVVAIAGNDTNFTYKGLETGALVYYRSQDLGVTWDIIDSVLPGIDTSHYIGHGGDSYSIDAKKNIVAVSYFPGWSDLICVKSSDNGDTWTKHIVNDMPVDKYEADQGFDLDSNAVQDSTQFFTTDGSGTVLIDNNDNVHIVFGSDFVFDWDLTDGGTFHLPLTGILAYWNESFGNDSVVQIAGYVDYNADDTVFTNDFLNGGTAADLPDYRVTGVSMPSMGISADGKLFVTYSALAELHTNGSTHFRHIYVLKSDDGGITWDEPKDFTPDFDFFLNEHVYPSMAKNVDTKCHIVFQQDQITGVYVIDEVNPSYNEIMYLGLDTALNAPVVGIDEVKTEIKANIYPNPATNELFVSLKSEVKGKLTLEVIDATGRVLLSEGAASSQNLSLVKLNVAALKNGAYNIIIKSDKAITSKTFIKQ